MKDYDWSKADANRVKTVFDGTADPHSQRQAVVHMVEILCGINQIGFDPENPHMTAFNAGRRWVARQIQNAITIPLDKLVKEEPNEPRPVHPISTTERAARAAVAGSKPAKRPVSAS